MRSVLAVQGSDAERDGAHRWIAYFGRIIATNYPSKKSFLEIESVCFESMAGLNRCARAEEHVAVVHAALGPLLNA